MRPCSHRFTRAATRCQKYCYAHDARHQEARSRAASKAARSKPRRELQALRKQASKLYDEVCSGGVEPKAGAVLTQITNTQARLLELERKNRETEELEERLEAVEGVLKGREKRTSA